MKIAKLVAVSLMLSGAVFSVGVNAAIPVAVIATNMTKKVEIAASELPQAIQDDVKKSYGAKIDKAYKLLDDASSKITGYEVRLKSSDNEIVLLYDANGKRVPQ